MTSTETRRTWSERVNPRNWTLAWKLVAIGVVPALLALALGALRVSDKAAEAAALGETTQLVQVRERIREFTEALRAERHAAAWHLASDRSADTDPGAAQQRTDTELAELRRALDGASSPATGTLAARQQLENRLDGLDQLRTDVTRASDLTPIQVIDRYGELIGQAHALDRALLREIRTPGTAGLADALTATMDAAEALALQHTVLAVVIRTGEVQDSDRTLVANTEHAIRAASSEYGLALTTDQLQRFGAFNDEAGHARRNELREAILATPPQTPVTVAIEDWNSAYETSKQQVEQAADRLRGELETLTRRAEERASNLAGIQSVILMLGMLLAASIVVVVARSLLRSLRVLRAAALEVADRRLPQAVERIRAGESVDVTIDPVPLHSHDEVGQVARAFDAVHEQAIRLAVDQAALQANVSSMFVNLSRRSQALVERQLALIEQLESNEQDPDQLANLFQLDHLATRMRRNSENLLILAGSDLGKRNVAPVPVIDVLRAAVSEIEQYQRVVVQPAPNATVVGRAASDLVHLLAELLDNATNFSPPDSQVIMSSTRTADGSLLIEISDQGVGMAEHELADANERLAGPSEVDVSVSRRMGLFVVGRLAARHGIGVRLSSVGHGPGTGLTASVVVPSYLIPTSDLPDPGRSRSRPALSPGAPGAPGTGPALTGAPTAASLARSSGPAQASPPDSAHGPIRQINGSPTGLPTRRPGASLRPDGSPVSSQPTTATSTTSSAAPQEPPTRRPAPSPHPAPSPQQPQQSTSASPAPAPRATPAPTAATEAAPSPTTGDTADETTGANTEPGPEVTGRSEPAAEREPAAEDQPASAATSSDEKTPDAAPSPAPAATTASTPPLRSVNGSSGPAGTTPPPSPPPASSSGEDLFAPAVPTTAEPSSSDWSLRRFDEPSDMTETTPIFEEVASAWFRSNRSVPVSWDTGENGGRATGSSTETSTPDTDRTSGEDGVSAPVRPVSGERKETAGTLSDEGFATSADEGWRAARNIDSGVEEITAAGLPKRRPRARLVPGSAGAAVLATSAAPTRSAESIRGRLASYQQGVRQGRETRLRRAAAASTDVINRTEPASTGGTNDEESR